MKKLIIFLALVSLVAANDLTAQVTGIPTFSGCNCRGNNDFNPIEISVSIRNPSDQSMRMSYDFYDPNTNEFRAGDSISCGLGPNIPARSLGSCTIRLYTMMGGLNGTSSILVKLTGDNGVDMYTKTFSVEIAHHASPYEENVRSRMDTAQGQFEQISGKLTGQCYGGVCCGMLRVNQYMSLALSNLYQANSSLRICALSSAWSYMSDAINSLNSASDQFTYLSGNCTAALSLISTTQSRISNVASTMEQSRKCGADVTTSESLLDDANNSLKEAKSMVVYDDYPALFSKLSDANNSIVSAVGSIGKCPKEQPNGVVVIPPSSHNTTNQTSQESSSSNNSTLIIGGLVVLVLLIAIVFSAMFFMRRRPSKKAPPAPPQPPVQKPDMHVELEKEFNDWLGSTQKKK
ncbi:MAG: hypothetical protein NT130_00355 [Candidatus Micrarchaeota archaeon]|nr:hypothetical protein [Candidatus Micrarchaeota archaeon]